MGNEIIFGYAVADKSTGGKAPTGRNVYDTKAAASGALTRLKKKVNEFPQWYPDTKIENLCVIALVAAPDE